MADFIWGHLLELWSGWIIFLGETVGKEEVDGDSEEGRSEAVDWQQGP